MTRVSDKWPYGSHDFAIPASFTLILLDYYLIICTHESLELVHYQGLVARKPVFRQSEFQTRLHSYRD